MTTQSHYCRRRRHRRHRRSSTSLPSSTSVVVVFVLLQSICTLASTQCVDTVFLWPVPWDLNMSAPGPNSDLTPTSRQNSTPRNCLACERCRRSKVKCDIRTAHLYPLSNIARRVHIPDRPNSHPGFGGGAKAAS